MMTRASLQRERLKHGLLHPRKGFPELRRHVRRRLGGALASILPRVRSGGWAPPPAQICYTINVSCNLSCFSCDTGTGDRSYISERIAASARPRLSLDEFRGIVRSLGRKVPEIYLCMMEPLLSPDAPDHVRVVAEEGLSSLMNTNGVLLAEKAAALVESGLHQLFVSLDGPSPEVNDPIRGRGAFERVLAGIRAVAREKEARGSHWPEITVCPTISERNTAHLVALADLAVGLPIQGLAYQHLWWVSQEIADAHNLRFPDYPVTAARTGSRPLEIDLGLLSGQIREVRNRFRAYPVSFSLDLSDAELETYYRRHLQPLRKDARCPVMWERLEMLPNGDVMVGSACPGHLFGNVRRAPLLEIWNSEEARAYRRRMTRELSPRCMHCYDAYRNA